MRKQQAFWRCFRQVRSCASEAQPQVGKLRQAWNFAHEHVALLTLIGTGIGGVVTWHHLSLARELEAQRIGEMRQQNKDKQKEFEKQTQAYLDNMLEDIVTAPYEPEVPIGREYVPRQQDGKLEKDLGDNIAKNTYFFMLTGESGSGKTTMMQHLLKKNYKEGVIFVAVNADKLSKVPSNMMRDVVEAAVLDKFSEKCYKHREAHSDFTDFIKHANEVRKRAKKEKAHPLIIYITLDTKNAKLSYDTMHDIAVAVGGMASDLSSKQNCCKTILEFSKTGISDNLRQIRGDFDRLEVGAMTEDEFLRIGKQVLAAKDPENLIEPYLKHYHDWLGGQTKTLTQLGGQLGGVGIDSMHHFVAFLYNMIINHTSHRS